MGFVYDYIILWFYTIYISITGRTLCQILSIQLQMRAADVLLTEKLMYVFQYSWNLKESFGENALPHAPNFEWLFQAEEKLSIATSYHTSYEILTLLRPSDNECHDRC